MICNLFNRKNKKEEQEQSRKQSTPIYLSDKDIAELNELKEILVDAKDKLELDTLSHKDRVIILLKQKEASRKVRILLQRILEEQNS